MKIFRFGRAIRTKKILSAISAFCLIFCITAIVIINNYKSINIVITPSEKKIYQISEAAIIKVNSFYGSPDVHTVYVKDPGIVPSFFVYDEKMAKKTSSNVNFEINGRAVNLTVPYYSEEDIAEGCLYPFKNPTNTDIQKYHFDNMKDGEVAVIDSKYKTPENLDYLARIIQCEIYLLGPDASRAVGTVVINRMASPLYPNTMMGVISQPGQFSPYPAGKFASCIPGKESYEAAYDVLYNGYRSFPIYVDSFQSISENYFSGYTPYVTYDNSTYHMYFSYNSKRT